MKARELMTAAPCCCSPEDSIQQVAKLMLEHDCGSVPVVEGNHVIGIVTDRDLAVRALADGMSAGTRVRNVMTVAPECCSENSDVREVERVMSDRQVRRVPIVNADGGVVGIIAQADIARAAATGSRVSEEEVAETVASISAPS